MFYMIYCICDNLILSKECIEELFTEYHKRYSNMIYLNTYIRKLLSKEDCFEYQDFTNSIKNNDKEILDILSKHKVNGNICFVRTKGFFNAKFFGYKFQNGKCNNTIGTTCWSDGNNSELLPKLLSEQDTLSLINSIKICNCKTSKQAIELVIKTAKSNNVLIDNDLVKRLIEEDYICYKTK